MDSELVLRNFFNPLYLPSSKLRHQWEHCLALLVDMNVRCSHIFCEGTCQLLVDMNVHCSHILRGNAPADILSNVALGFPEFTWWDNGIPEISAYVCE